ncbi:type IX secretion system membrane protein PorP/SprF [Maribacter sp. HTCC2170]|uniref:PorP/SprF family type IX secretion system membrane protein n=1 Tax=Maribacter sp. (strain HTCC2170 / KCCM 42371) TaxID=313603 RepID=UPI00006B2217|nr:type IX secretion system membrane protein PorP/SprF [Maribacter sp. HTCC2170]EAR00394.1 hypothetical protein FB2170_13271 [Maribacter sp. HTCC2170]
MPKAKLSILFFLIACAMNSQEVGLPLDLRQHNLTSSNSVLFNPAFSSNYESSQSIGLWTRWQWQMIDGDPTTLFLNYTGRLDDSSSMGVGFYQHNTGVYLNTGGVVNYSRTYDFADNVQISLGINVFAYLNQLADDRFQIDPQIQLPLQSNTEDFIVQIAPGILFRYDKLSLGLVSENLIGYNITTKENSPFSADKIILGTVGYVFPLSVGELENSAFISPVIYFKAIPGFSKQIGLNTSLITNRFWAQAGYNSFYGISIGGGGKFFNRFSLGVLAEFGTESGLKEKDPTFELVTSFDFGRIKPRKKIKSFEEPKEESLEEIAENEKIKDELSKAETLALKKEKQQQAKELKRKTRDSLALVKKEADLAADLKKEQNRKADSISRSKQKEALALQRITKQKRLDSITAANKAKSIAEVNKQKEQVRQDSIKKAKEADALADAQQKEIQRKVDSINAIKVAAEAAAKEKARLAEIAQKTEEDKPQAGEKYEEVVGEDGLTPGYYLIANVFGTKRYFDAFMADLNKKGLQPKSFFRSRNKYNYVYLERYDTMGEARKARDGKFNGRYAEKTWIYRVVAK